MITAPSAARLEPPTSKHSNTFTVMSKHQGKIALITGGTSGLGLATAKRFVAEGAYVFITGRRQPELDAAVKEIGSNVTGIQGDVAKSADLDRLFATIRQLKGRLDILFANAGGGAFVPLEQVTEEHFDKYFGINVKGTLFTVQKALALMPTGGAIVINGSMVSIKGFPAFGVYAATKAALRSFARTWSVDLKGRNIRVNVVSPGTIITPGYKNELGLSDEQIEQFKAQAAATTPLGRAGTPDEIAKAVSFLASDDSSYITGIELFVDGGAAQV
jgi:NAD(P)-dependent dehydrogenase (short-subunit alcohol dehydrogenase family)